MIDDKRLEEMAEVWVDAHSYCNINRDPEACSYMAGFRACEALTENEYKKHYDLLKDSNKGNERLAKTKDAWGLELIKLEAKAEKLAESLESLIHYSSMASHRLLDLDNIPLSCSVKVARQCLAEYRGDK